MPTRSIRFDPLGSRPTSVPKARPVPDDVFAIVAALGGNASVIAFYDYRSGPEVVGSSVNTWVDVRGGALGSAMTASGTTRPTTSFPGISFNGTTNWMRCDSSAWAGLPDNLLISAVLVPPASSVATQRNYYSVSDAGGNAVLAAFTISSRLSVVMSRSGYSTPNSGAFVGLTGPQVLHGYHTSAGTLTVGIGNTSLSSFSNTAASLTATRLTMCANAPDDPSRLADTSMLALIAVANPASNATTLINNWASSVHGASL